MKHIYITEDNIRQMVVESVRYLITESQRSRQAKREMEKVAKSFNVDDSEINELITLFRKTVYHGIDLGDKYGHKYAPSFFRMYINDEITDIGKANDVIKYLIKLCNEKDGFVINPDSFNVDAFNKISSEYDEYNTKQMEDANNVEYAGDTRYKILSDIDFDTAKKYGDYSSPDSPLCYTQKEDVWEDWTSGGLNTCYLLLRDDWATVKPVHEDGTNSHKGNPYDDYGESMIYIFVDPKGNLVKSNTRWNHDADYTTHNTDCDHAYTPAEISQLVGKPFRKAFPPNKERLEKRKDELEELYRNLKTCSDLWDLFDDVDEDGDYSIVKFKSMYNVITDGNKILSPQVWFNDISFENDGFFAVYNQSFGGNFLNKDGTFLLDVWPDRCLSFKEGVAVIKRGNKFTYIKTDGTYLTDMWFDNAESLHEGFGAVKNNGKWNFIKKDGTLLWNGKPFSEVRRFNEGHAVVKNDEGYYNFINSDCTFVWDGPWFENVSPQFMFGFACVRRREDHKWNFLKENGEILKPDTWFNKVFDFDKIGCGIVRNENRQYNFIDKNGKIIYDGEWFVSFYFGDNKTYWNVMCSDRKWHRLYKNGTLV